MNTKNATPATCRTSLAAWAFILPMEAQAEVAALLAKAAALDALVNAVDAALTADSGNRPRITVAGGNALHAALTAAKSAQVSK